MSIQNKPDYKIFAGSAKSGEVVSFPDIARGWGVTIDKTGEIPPMEWFNAIGKRADEWLMYLTQRGVSQWDSNVEYPTMALIQYGGNYYVSLKNNKGQDPTSSSASWENIKKWIGLDGKLNTSDVSQSTGSSTTKVMSQKAVTESLDLKVNYSAIVQATGQNQYSLMSQKAVTDALGLKVNYSAIVQTTGQNDYSVMSQKAVSNQLFGVGQAWQDVTASRAYNTTHTNTTGRTITVFLVGSTNAGHQLSFTLNGIVCDHFKFSNTGQNINITVIIPPAGTYSFNGSGVNAEYFKWLELR